MQYRGLFIFVMGALLLAACSGAAPATQSPAATMALTPYPQAYPPAPEGNPIPTTPSQAVQAYPAATADTVQTGPLYPNVADGAQVPWSQAYAMIFNSEVSKILQTQDKKIFLTLKDGRTIFTEAEIDMITQVIQQCGQPCSSIEIATE